MRFLLLNTGRAATYLLCVIVGILLMIVFRPAPTDLLTSFTFASVATTVLAIGLPLVTAYSGFRTGGQWGREYLFKGTGLPVFAVCTGVTAALAVACHELLVLARTGGATPILVTGGVMFAGVVLGLVVATLVQLLAIILEIIHFAKNPCFVWAATGHLAAQRILESLLSNVYNRVFVGVRDDLLDEQCSRLSGVVGPERYIREAYFAEGREVRVSCKLCPDTESLDLYLPAMSRVAEHATQAGGTMYFAPHAGMFMSPDGKSIIIGKMIPGESRSISLDSACLCGRPDFCRSWSYERKGQLVDTFVRICGETFEQGDTYGFRILMKALRAGLLEFAKEWHTSQAEPKSPQNMPAEMDPDTAIDWHLWVDVHRRVLTQVLHARPRVDLTPDRQCFEFVECLQNSWLNLISECAELGSPEMLKILFGYVPTLYRMMKTGIERSLNRGDRSESEQATYQLIEKTGLWGHFLASPEHFIDSLPSTVSGEDRWQILICLHLTGGQWLRQVLDEYPFTGKWAEQRLCEELCEGLGEIMAIADKWKSDHRSPQNLDNILQVRHWCLLGDLIMRAMKPSPAVSEDMLSGLYHESFKKKTPEEYLQFYNRNPSVDEFSPWHRDIMPPDKWIHGPVSDYKKGVFRGVSRHTEEMQCAFLWLVAKSGKAYHLGSLPPSIPVRLDVEPFSRALQKMQQSDFMDTFNAHDLCCQQDGKHWIIEWLEGCNHEFDHERQDKIAQAILLPQRVDRFLTEFRKSFDTNLVVAKFLVRNRAYRIDRDASAGSGRNLVSKTEFISTADGGHEYNSADYHGPGFARYIDDKIVNEFVIKGMLVRGGEKTGGSKADEPDATSQQPASRPEGPHLLRPVDKAAEWLKSRQCSPGEGLICIVTDSHIRGDLCDSEHFRPSWLDTDPQPGFEGKYRDYLVWRGRIENNVESVVAVDTRDWRALQVQEEVLHGQWSEPSVRLLTNADLENIKSACEKKKQAFNEGKYRQDCLFECRLLLSLEVSDVESHVAVFHRKTRKAPSENGEEQ